MSETMLVRRLAVFEMEKASYLRVIFELYSKAGKKAPRLLFGHMSVETSETAC